MRHKYITLCAVFLMLSVALFTATSLAEPGEPVPASGIALPSAAFTLYDGRAAQLSYALIPPGATDVPVWSSSAPAIASVDQNGLVYARKAGTAYITAKLPNGKFARVQVKVQATKVALTPASLSIFETKTAQLSASDRPAGSAFAPRFSSNKSAVASVDQAGVVTAKKPGTATITARFANGQSAQCRVTVKRGTVKLNRVSAALYRGETVALIPAVNPPDIAKPVLYRSSKPAVATVGANGTITAHSAGTATVYATLGNGQSASCKVTVKREIVQFTQAALSIYESEYAQLGTRITPAHVSSPVTFKSSGATVASVSASGLVLGKKAGTAYVTALLKNGSSARVKVTVLKRAIALEDRLVVSLDERNIPVAAQLKPPGSGDAKIEWASGNPAVVTVDAQGRLTPVSLGNATITAKLTNGAIAKCAVSVVSRRVDSVALNATSARVAPLEPRKLTATVHPADASMNAIVWSSSDPKIAKVSADGLVSAVGPGTAVITAKTVDGGKTASCKVTAEAPALRALLIGEHTDPSVKGYMKVTRYGITNMRSALARCRLMGASYAITADANSPGKAAIQSYIRTTFAGTAPGDVSILYILSHGIDYEGAFFITLPGWYDVDGNPKEYSISSGELFAWLDGIRGHLVLVVNACNSGKVIDDLPACVTSSHSLYGNITVIASSQWKVGSAAVQSTTMYDFMSYAIGRGIGWDVSTAKPLSKMYADGNGDGVVSANEFAIFARASVAERVNKYFGKSGYVGPKTIKPMAQIYVSNPNVPVFGG